MISDLGFALQLAVGVGVIAVIGFVLSEEWAEHQRQQIVRRRRAALADQRKAIRQWVLTKRG